MDALDERIAAELSRNGRATNRALADLLGVSPRVVGTRIAEMVRAQKLRVATVADIFAAGNDLMLAIGVGVAGRPTMEVAEELSAFERVCAVNVVNGEFDLEILMLCEDHEDLRTFVGSELASVRGVGRLAPAITLEVFKFESTWARFE